jgi:hypothetical protein
VESVECLFEGQKIPHGLKLLFSGAVGGAAESLALPKTYL